MEVLFSEVIPTPRDVVIICLANACGLFTELLSRRELRLAQPRIELMQKMDLIGRAVMAASGTSGDSAAHRTADRSRGKSRAVIRP